jgi:hypothetical protein
MLRAELGARRLAEVAVDVLRGERARFTRLVEILEELLARHFADEPDDAAVDQFELPLLARFA